MRLGCADGVPDLDRASAALGVMGWRIIAVSDLLPDGAFFDPLAARRFPVTVWLRRPEEMDYWESPTSSTTSSAMCRCSRTPISRASTPISRASSKATGASARWRRAGAR